LDDAINKLRDAVRRGDAAAAAAAAKELAMWIQRQVELGRRLAAECTDPALKKKILDACDELEQLCPLIIQAVKDALMNPGDKAAQDRLNKLLDQARRANQVIVDAAEKMRSKKKGNNDDKIMAAAHDVENSVKEAQKKESLVPTVREFKSLLDIAAAIAIEMENLSRAAQMKSKKDMILVARKIAGMIGQIEGFSVDISKKCTDAKLRERLLAISKAPQNFAIQLKIIAAVKTGSGDNDSSAEAQLVTCAQGLANSVVQTVHAAGSASIKCPKEKF